MNTEFIHNIRVYYEDTDAAGIVYYANYLKFAERARTEWLRTIGIDQHDLMKSQGIGFVVRRVTCDFIAPAVLDDLLTIKTHIEDIRKVRLTMLQTIWRKEEKLVEVRVEIACVNAQRKPQELPEKLLNACRPLT
jgi:acyl-CoA thioester hydrolase